MVWALSSFLDNIAAALIGVAIAHQLFRAKVHIGYLAAIVAASNAGGSWSVIAHTTTKMMWIAGVSPRQVFEAIIASIVALLVFGIPAAIKQPRHSPILKHAHEHVRKDAASSAEEFDFFALARFNRLHNAGRTFAQRLFADGTRPQLFILRV